MITMPEKIKKLNPEKLDYTDVDEIKKILYMLMNCIENVCTEIRKLDEAMSLLEKRTTQARNMKK